MGSNGAVGSGRARTTLAVAALALMSVVAPLTGCSRDDFEDRTAEVTVGEEKLRFRLDSCGLDESTLFVVGRSDEGEVLQAVVGLEGDGSTGDPRATGLTVDVGDASYAAFGESSWELRDGDGSAPGTISWSRLRGARIQISAEADPVDDQGMPLSDPGADSVRIDVDARCDERDAA